MVLLVNNIIRSKRVSLQQPTKFANVIKKSLARSMKLIVEQL